MSNGLKTFFTELADVYRGATGTTEKIIANTLPSKFEELLENSGGDLVAYVSFMSEDGLTHLFDMPVLKGDNCKDPISHGDIEKPTKESDNYYNYSYSGWSATTNGSANSSVLNNITENKTVYASFSASTRYYTVSFYDDGTLLSTKSTTYGGSATYTPIKENYDFIGWEPEPTNVQGDMSCYAVWKERIGFGVMSWAEISEISQSGNARNYFNLGDRKSVRVEWTGNYTPETVEVEILDFLDGGGIEIGMVDVFKNRHAPRNMTTNGDGTITGVGFYNDAYGYSASLAHRALIPVWTLPFFETDFQNVLLEHERECYISTVTGTNTTIEKITAKAFLPSIAELGQTFAKDGVQFAHKTLAKSQEYLTRTAMTKGEYYYYNKSQNKLIPYTSLNPHGFYFSLVFRV